MIVEGEEVTVLKEFPVLYSGWEMDNIGYIVEFRNEKHIVFTSHGRPYFAKTKEVEEKLKEYKQVIQATRHALRVVYGQEDV